MGACGVLSLFYIDRVASEFYCFDLSQISTPDKSHLFATSNLGLLRCKAITMHGGLRSAANRIDVDEVCQSRTLLKKLLCRELGEPEVLPPDCLFLPAVPVQHVRQNPAGLLLAAALS